MTVKISLASEVRPSHWIPFYYYVVDTDKLDNTETLEMLVHNTAENSMMFVISSLESPGSLNVLPALT